MPSIISAYIAAFFPPAATFKPENLPDLEGKVFIVTGGNSGIGRETVQHLLAHNAKVYIAARNPTLIDEAIKDLKAKTGKEAIALKCDLADLHSVKAAAEEFLRKEDRLHVLVNNAGVMAPPLELLTTQGYDLQFGVNVLGPFYLTKLLLPVLISTAKGSPDGKARIVNISSSMHLHGWLDYNTFKDSPARRKRGLYMLYSQSKYGTVVFAHELARRYGDQGIVSTSVHPGMIQSGLFRTSAFVSSSKLQKIFMAPVSKGVLTPLYAAAAPEGVGLNGKYLIPWARVSEPLASTLDPKTGEELWKWLEEQVANF